MSSPSAADLAAAEKAVADKKAAENAAAAAATTAANWPIGGGAGPTAVAVIEGEEKGEEIARRMIDAFLSVGKLKATATVSQLDRAGARVISTSGLE